MLLFFPTRIITGFWLEVSFILSESSTQELIVLLLEEILKAAFPLQTKLCAKYAQTSKRQCAAVRNHVVVAFFKGEKPADLVIKR